MASICPWKKSPRFISNVVVIMGQYFTWLHDGLSYKANRVQLGNVFNCRWLMCGCLANKIDQKWVLVFNVNTSSIDIRVDNVVDLVLKHTTKVKKSQYIICRMHRKFLTGTNRANKKYNAIYATIGYIHSYDGTMTQASSSWSIECKTLYYRPHTWYTKVIISATDVTDEAVAD